MSASLYIGLRFTTSRKRSLAFSLMGVIFGVAFFICTQAQTQGFEEYFIKTVLGTSGAVIVSDRFQVRMTPFSSAGSGTVMGDQAPRKYYEGVSNPDEVMRVIRQFSNVAACAPVVQGNVAARGDFQSEVVTIQGIDLDLHLAATSLGSQVTPGNGSLDEFRVNPSGLILGSLLAEKMQVKVGDSVTLSGTGGERRVMTLCAIATSGNNIIDDRRGYVNLRLAQRLLGKPSQVTMIIVALRDPEKAPAIAAHFERLFAHRSRAWQVRERGNLQIFSTLRLSAAITVSLIILLAGVLIFNTLTMTVLDKAREIAILRSMGYRRLDITLIFLFQGFLVATIGSLLGAAGGALLTYGVSLIPVKITGFFSTDHFVVAWSPTHYFHAVMIAFFAVLTASYFPARRAANLAPVEILRGSGQ